MFEFQALTLCEVDESNESHCMSSSVTGTVFSIASHVWAVLCVLDRDCTIAEYVTAQGRLTFTLYELPATIQKCQAQSWLDFSPKPVILNSLPLETHVFSVPAKVTVTPGLPHHMEQHEGTDPFLMHLSGRPSPSLAHTQHRPSVCHSIWVSFWFSFWNPLMAYASRAPVH